MIVGNDELLRERYTTEPGLSWENKHLRVTINKSCCCCLCVQLLDTDECYGQGNSSLSLSTCCTRIHFFFAERTHIHMCSTLNCGNARSAFGFHDRGRGIEIIQKGIQCYALPAISFSGSSCCTFSHSLVARSSRDVMIIFYMVGLWYNGIGILLQHFMTQYSFNFRDQFHDDEIPLVYGYDCIVDGNRCAERKKWEK